MKVIAFITDCCNELKLEIDVLGISPQMDMLDIHNSYKTISDPNKAEIHYCTRCYNKYVLEPLKHTVDRRKDETEYIYQLNILSYKFKNMVIEKGIKKNIL